MTYYRIATFWHLAYCDFDPAELGAICGVRLDNGTYQKSNNPPQESICRRCRNPKGSSMDSAADGLDYLEAAASRGDYCPDQFIKAIRLIRQERDAIGLVASNRLASLEDHRQHHMETKGLLEKAEQQLQAADRLAVAIGRLKCYEVGVGPSIHYHEYTRLRGLKHPDESPA